MDVLATSREKIFPHQVSCVVLIYHVCKYDNDQELSVLCKKWRCRVVLLLLSFIQKIHIDYENLLVKVEKATSRELVDVFEKKMLSIIENKYMGLLDLFDSLEQLTLTSNQYVHRSSLFGVFMRKMFLQYQKMSFTDTGDLGKSVDLYLKSSRSDEMQDALSPSYMEVNQQAVKRQEAHEEMSSLSEASRFIAIQTKLIESQATNSLSPRELHSKIQEIIQRFPLMVDAYYLSYLNQLQISEVRNALFDLHRYFDYKKWDDDLVKSDAEKTSLEKHQMKFKRFRYCALNLGVFHFQHQHYEIALAALEEAVKMAQETNDNHCLLHAMFWLYQLKLESDPKLAQSVLSQLNRKAKELGVAEIQILGSLLQCKSDAFSGKSTFNGTLENLKEIDCACSAKSGVATGKIEIAKAALFDFYGYRFVSIFSSQMVLFYLHSNRDFMSDSSTLYDQSDPESSTLAVCQLAKCLADEGHFLAAEKILSFGSSLIPEHSSLHKWLCICKWQLVFEQSVLSRDLESADTAINQLKVHENEDAQFKSCVLDYLRGNFVSASAKVDRMLEEAETRLQRSVGCTPGAVYAVKLLQLKAELCASSNGFSKAITCLTKATDICRRFEMKSLEAELAISTAQCMIYLDLPLHAKQMIDGHMMRILSHGTLYAKSLSFLVLAKASLFCLKELLPNCKSELLQLLPSLGRSLEGLQLVGASAAQEEVLFIMAQIYDCLEYTSKRNHYAKEVRIKHEEMPMRRRVKLFL